MCWQQAEVARSEILLEIEEPKRAPVTITFHI
jgi:hypothetical protein